MWCIYTPGGMQHVSGEGGGNEGFLSSFPLYIPSSSENCPTALVLYLLAQWSRLVLDLSVGQIQLVFPLWRSPTWGGEQGHGPGPNVALCEGMGGGHDQAPTQPWVGGGEGASSVEEVVVAQPNLVCAA